jgi:hypothetical protein
MFCIVGLIYTKESKLLGFIEISHKYDGVAHLVRVPKVWMSRVCLKSFDGLFEKGCIALLVAKEE